MRLTTMQAKERLKEITRLLHTLRNEHAFNPRHGRGITIAIQVLRLRARVLAAGDAAYSGRRGAIQTPPERKKARG